MRAKPIKQVLKATWAKTPGVTRLQKIRKWGGIVSTFVLGSAAAYGIIMTWRLVIFENNPLLGLVLAIPMVFASFLPMHIALNVSERVWRLE
jgi:CHASE2 domain-containing sensor protein